MTTRSINAKKNYFRIKTKNTTKLCLAWKKSSKDKTFFTDCKN